MKIKIFWNGKYSSKPMLKALLVFCGFIVVTVIGVIVGRQSLIPDNAAVPAFAENGGPSKEENLMHDIMAIVGFDTGKAKKALGCTIPFFDEIENRQSNPDTRQLIQMALYSVTHIDVTDPKSYIQGEIPLLSSTPYEEAQAVTETEGEENQVENENTQPESSVITEPPVTQQGPEPTAEVWKSHPWKGALSNDVLVGIYHTHNSECYVPSSGVDHKTDALGDVFNVGEALKIFLEEEHGIKVYQSRQIHDYPALRYAYGKSIYTAEAFVKRFPHLKMLLDIHRDAMDRQYTTVKIAGQDVARILIVVGSNQTPSLPNPNWEKNYAFAQKINKKMGEMYPGLSRGIKVAKGRYNQQVSPDALLLEIGAHTNTREEAIRSAKLLADVLAAIINEENQNQP